MATAVDNTVTMATGDVTMATDTDHYELPRKYRICHDDDDNSLPPLAHGDLGEDHQGDNNDEEIDQFLSSELPADPSTFM